MKKIVVNKKNVFFFRMSQKSRMLYLNLKKILKLLNTIKILSLILTQKYVLKEKFKLKTSEK